jgi:hypothetical protein
LPSSADYFLPWARCKGFLGAGGTHLGEMIGVMFEKNKRIKE